MMPGSAQSALYSIALLAHSEIQVHSEKLFFLFTKIKKLLDLGHKPFVAADPFFGNSRALAFLCRRAAPLE